MPAPSSAARSRRFASIALAVAHVAALSACNGGGDPGADAGVMPVTPVASLAIVTAAPASGAAGMKLAPAPVVEARDSAGAPIAGATLMGQIALGGGSANPVVTGADGRAALDWTLGVAPVANALVVSSGTGSVRLETRGTLATPWGTERFGDVDAYLDGVSQAGSTEDLAFREKAGGGHELLLAAPKTLFALASDGAASGITTSGGTLEGPLGVAVDAAGALWIADSKGKALKRMDPSGVIETVLTTDGVDPLVAPNFVAMGPGGRVYLSDPCLGKLLRYDPQSKKVEATIAFDRKTQGGPNGFAFNREGTALWLATESTGFLCQHVDVGLQDPIAGFFRIPIGDPDFGALETVAANQGLFGDGVAVDAEDNVYVIFDQEKDFALAESAIFVLPAGQSQLLKLAATKERIYANLEFGQGAFGETKLYVALLAIPLFGVNERGVHRIELGIPGLPLRR